MCEIRNLFHICGVTFVFNSSLFQRLERQRSSTMTSLRRRRYVLSHFASHVMSWPQVGKMHCMQVVVFKSRNIITWHNHVMSLQNASLYVLVFLCHVKSTFSWTHNPVRKYVEYNSQIQLQSGGRKCTFNNNLLYVWGFNRLTGCIYSTYYSIIMQLNNYNVYTSFCRSQSSTSWGRFHSQSASRNMTCLCWISSQKQEIVVMKYAMVLYGPTGDTVFRKDIYAVMGETTFDMLNAELLPTDGKPRVVEVRHRLVNWLTLCLLVVVLFGVNVLPFNLEVRGNAAQSRASVSLSVSMSWYQPDALWMNPIEHIHKAIRMALLSCREAKIYALSVMSQPSWIFNFRFLMVAKLYNRIAAWTRPRWVIYLSALSVPLIDLLSHTSLAKTEQCWVTL